MCAGMVRVCVYLSLVLLLGFSLWEPVDGRRTRWKPKPKPKQDIKPTEETVPARDIDINSVRFTESVFSLPVSFCFEQFVTSAFSTAFEYACLCIETLDKTAGFKIFWLHGILENVSSENLAYTVKH